MPSFRKIVLLLFLMTSFQAKASGYSPRLRAIRAGLEAGIKRNQFYLKAAEGGQLDELKKVVEEGVLFNVTDLESENACHKIARGGSSEALEFILKAMKTEADKHSYKQAYRGDEWRWRSADDILLENRKRCGKIQKEFLNHKNERGESPAFLAALFGNYRVLKILVDHGSDPHFKNREGETLLHAAVKRGNVLCVEYLLGQGLRKYKKDKKGVTPASLLVEKTTEGLIREDSYEAIRLLFDEKKESFCEVLSCGKVRMTEEEREKMLHPFRTQALFKEMMSQGEKNSLSQGAQSLIQEIIDVSLDEVPFSDDESEEIE